MGHREFGTMHTAPATISVKLSDVEQKIYDECPVGTRVRFASRHGAAGVGVVRLVGWYDGLFVTVADDDGIGWHMHPQFGDTVEVLGGT